MITISASGIIDVQKYLRNVMDRQHPFVLSLAVNRTTSEAQKYVKQQMPHILDRPTPFTVNSTWMRKGTIHNPTAVIEYREWATKGTPAGKYLKPVVYSGAREGKRSEILLRQRGIIKAGQFIVPSSATQLNKYGNVPAGKMTKMLSALQASHESTWWSKKKSKKTKFFYLIRNGVGVIFERLNKVEIKPFLIVIDRPPVYHIMFPFDRLVYTSVSKTFEQHYNEAWKFAMETKR